MATAMTVKQSGQYKGDPGLELGPCSSIAQAATAVAAIAVCSQPQQELHGQRGTGTTHVWWHPWSLDDTGLRLLLRALAGKELLGYSPSGIWPHQCRRNTKSNESMTGKLILRVKWIWSNISVSPLVTVGPLATLLQLADYWLPPICLKFQYKPVFR